MKKKMSFSGYKFIPFPVLIFDFQDELVYYNESASKILGINKYTEEEIASLKASLEEASSEVSPDGFFTVTIKDTKFLASGNNVDVNATNYHMFFLCSREKIAELESKLTELKKEMAIIQKMIDSSYDGIYLTDGEGKTLYFNDSFMKISGFKREEVYGKRLQDLVKENYLPNSCSTEVVKTRKPYTTIINYYNGVQAIATGMPIFDEEGKLVRVFCNVRDITELNRLKTELDDIYALSDGYRRQLKEFQRQCLTKAKIIANSKAMTDIIDLIMKAAYADTPILITGESGVGKDEIAKFIHNVSESSKKGPFIRINCSAIPEHLLESELFGYEPHAFTGADRSGKAGLFQLADGGTLFLNEIGDMPLSLQSKLLDAIQEKAFRRLGGIKSIRFNARIISATNKDLEKLIDEKKFRLDLYYRLNVISIHIPPLRERTEDILPLINLFLDEYNEKYKQNKKLSPRVLEKLMEYSWPGNIRELKNVIERLVVTNTANYIDVDALPFSLKTKHEPYKSEGIYEYSAQIREGRDMKEVLENIERRMIANALKQTKNMREAARLLGIDLSTLVRKKKRYFV